ncbi:MAG: hypothetical protein KIT45_13260 [Fimbriimonadia bacterium]|nr:hypothetical protein [Fimbriimonadia bacterium]
MKRPLEWFSIALIGLGIVGLCQPWLFAWYRYSFTILLIGTLLFTIVSHLPEPKKAGS